MEININNLEILLNKKFFGNKSLLAKTLKLEVSHVNKVFNNKGKGAGAKFCGAIIKYCEMNKMDYKDYIFFNETVNKFTNLPQSDTK